jgi:hypothetical protein
VENGKYRKVQKRKGLRIASSVKDFFGGRGDK